MKSKLATRKENVRVHQITALNLLHCIIQYGGKNQKEKSNWIIGGDLIKRAVHNVQPEIIEGNK